MDDDYSYIQPEIKPYFDSFIFEAAKRGVIVDVTTVKIAFGDLKGKCGAITYYKENAIVVDSSTYNWKHERENTVFHELGHLLLHRKHNNAMLNETEPKSIMNDGSHPARFSNDPAKREYYLDELFYGS